MTDNYDCCAVPTYYNHNVEGNKTKSSKDFWITNDKIEHFARLINKALFRQNDFENQKTTISKIEKRFNFKSILYVGVWYRQ